MPDEKHDQADDQADDRLTDLLRLPPGPVDLAGTDPAGAPGFTAGSGAGKGAGKGVGKSAGKQALAALGDELNDLSRRLFAEGNTGGQRRVLVVLQGMDTAGKGGVVRHVAPLLDAQTWQLATFGRPTAEEASHDFLWRVKKRLPGPGRVAFFDRSHYEDAVVARVNGTIDQAETERRCARINRFEARLARAGTTLLKCFLHISADTQRERLLARLDDPTKHWKYDPRDLDDRAQWVDHQAQYATVLGACSPAIAPWHVVPADRKWYRNWAVAHLLLEQLRALDPQWPAAAFDVAAQRRLLVDGAG